MSGTQEGIARALIKLLQMSVFFISRESYCASKTKAPEF